MTDAYPHHYLNPEQQDLGEELKRYWQILRRRRWILITTLVLSSTTALIYSSYQVPMYRAAATLIIESDIPQLSKLDQSQNSKSSDKFYRSQYEIISSYAVAKKAFGMLGLDENPHEPSADPIAGFQGLFRVEPVKGSQLVRISSTGLDSERVAKRVNTLARAYVEHNLEDRHKSSSDAFIWLSEQLRILEAQVASSEKDLLTFQAQEDILALDRRQSLLEERLSEWAEKQTHATISKMELETLIRELNPLRGRPEMLDALPKELQNSTILELKTDYAKQNARLAQLSRKLKPRHPKIVDLESQIASLRNSLSAELENVARGLEVDHRIKQTNEAEIKANLEELKRQSARLAQQGIEYAVLQRKAESNRHMYDVLLHRLKQTDIGSNITINNVRIVDPARISTTPIGPSRARLTHYGFWLGLFLGLILCFLTEMVDNRLRNEEDVQLYLDLPVIGSVPKKTGDSARFIHAYRDIKTQLSFYAEEHRFKSLLITSSLPEEGKTTTMVQLGQAFAQSGEKVLLIDADLYRPRLRHLFEISSEAGLTDLIHGERDPDDVIVEGGTPNLYILPAGPLPQNPPEILASQKMPGLLGALKETFDIILIETAPLSAGLEAAALGRIADGIVLIVLSDSTPRSAVKKVARQLRNLKGNLLGVILTAVAPTEEGPGYYYETYARRESTWQAAK